MLNKLLKTLIFNKFMIADKPTVIFVLGGPGAGKGTQCTIISEKYSYVHLSAGDLLRQQRNSGSENGQLIQKIINEGKIVPSQITVGLLKKAMEKKKEIGKFLIDGFPRNFQNMQSWNSKMGQEVQTPFILDFVADEQTLINRIIKRAQSSGRTDDNIEVLKKRLDTFYNETRPVVEAYAKQDKCKVIDGAKPVEEVTKELDKIFSQL